MTILLLAPVLAPAAAALFAALSPRRATSALLTTLAAVTIATCGAILAARVGGGAVSGLGHLLRADALSATMLLVIGAVGTLCAWAGSAYLTGALAAGKTTPRRARLYSILVPAFLSAMALAVSTGNIGVMWAAVEATTVVTAFLVGHRGSRAAVEAAWKYVVLCSVGIALALLGTVLLYFAARHAGVPAGQALDIDSLLAHAGALDPAVTRLAAGLLLLGYGTKAGLVPFHTWLADAHSQAPAPVSGLMSGVLLAVGFAALLRVKPVIDQAIGANFLRTGLLIVGLATIAVAALMLLVQTDFKRMLAYSSMENMGLVAVAAAVGTRLAIAALLLHVLAHGVGKSVLFLAAGQLQTAHDSTEIAAVRGVLARSRLLATALGVGLAAIVAFPPFALFASEITIARSLAEVGLGWVLAVVGVLVVIAFAALVQRGTRMMFGTAAPESPAIAVPRGVAFPLVIGIAGCLLLGVAAAPLTGLLQQAGALIGIL